MLILTRDLVQMRKDLKHLQESLVIWLDQGTLEGTEGFAGDRPSAIVIPLHPKPKE